MTSRFSADHAVIVSTILSNLEFLDECAPARNRRQGHD
jgi:hypothetical protein